MARRKPTPIAQDASSRPGTPDRIKTEPADTRSVISRFPPFPEATNGSESSLDSPPATAHRRTVEPISRDAYSATDYIKAESTDTGSATSRAPSAPKSSSRKRRATNTRKSPAKAPEPTDSSSFFQDSVIGGSGYIFSFIGDSILTAMKIIKKPLSVLLGMYLIAVIGSLALHFLSDRMLTALSPLCKAPGVALFDFSFCSHTPTPTNSTKGRRGRKSENTDFPELINLQFNFESILENSVGGSSMALDLKNSEVAIRDLNTLVRVSELQCRNELSSHLNDFTTAAKSASRGLSRFGSRVNGVIDSLLAIDEYALRKLEEARAAEIGGSPASMIVSLALAPFKSWGKNVEVEKDILATFLQTSNIMDNSIQRLIIEAVNVLRDLDDLENRLVLIQDMVSMEDSILKEKHNEVLAELWTIVGGNRKKLSNFASHRSLLKGINVYRTKALAHVTSSLLQLQQMESDLDDLRDRVMSPTLLADAGKEAMGLRFEVYIGSIRKGVERLNSGRVKAKGVEDEYMKKILGMHNEAIIMLD